MSTKAECEPLRTQLPANQIPEGGRAKVGSTGRPHQVRVVDPTPRRPTQALLTEDVGQLAAVIQLAGCSTPFAHENRKFPRAANRFPPRLGGPVSVNVSGVEQIMRIEMDRAQVEGPRDTAYQDQARRADSANLVHQARSPRDPLCRPYQAPIGFHHRAASIEEVNGTRVIVQRVVRLVEKIE